MKITVPRVLGAAFGAVLVAYTFVFAPRMPAGVAHHLAEAIGGAAPRPSASHSTPAPQAFPSAGKKFVGIMTSSGPYNYTDLDNFTKAVGRAPSVYEFAQGWAVNQFNRGIIESVASRGMLPLISWEPWDYLDNAPGAQKSGDQPAYKLSNIIDGKYDSYIRSWAEGVKSLGFTIGIRFAHEMNGNWYPWCVFSNGNTVSQYVQAWRHVHDIFTEVGATNVIWVWSPNIIWNDFTDLAQLYPGNNYVNWIGLSGYYGTPGMNDYMSFNTVFDRTLSELETFTRKPVVITETGGTDTAGLMAQYVTQMFQQLPAHPNIIGVIWFEAFNVVDWSVADHPQAAAAFARGYDNNPLYSVQWKPGMVPIETVPEPSAQTSQPAATSAAGTPPTAPTRPAATTAATAPRTKPTPTTPAFRPTPTPRPTTPSPSPTTPSPEPTTPSPEPTPTPTG